MRHILFDLVKKYDVITIFRHISPDSDALGSQFALKQWITETYPDKKVYALGFENGSELKSFPKMDTAEDETIQSSLAIILDTATRSRVDDQRYLMAKYRLRIDHHIFCEQVADEEIIEDLAGATCEILASIFKENGIHVSQACAQYLYSGLIADTLRFSISTITPETLRIAAYLLECGVDVAKANEENFSTSLRLYRYENYLRENCQIMDDEIAYIIVRKEDYERFGLSLNEAKGKVFVMGGVHEFKAWALFIEKTRDENGNVLFSGSLRSKNKVINDIAEKYHGGGHRFACGVSDLTLDDIKSLLHLIQLRVHEA